MRLAVMRRKERRDGASSFACEYHAGGASSSEGFLWDGLALVRRGSVSYVNGPHPGGGEILASSDGAAHFNDHLGTTLGVRSADGYVPTPHTAFGDVPPAGAAGTPRPAIGNDVGIAASLSPSSSSPAFFMGRPRVAGLGHVFLLRSYRADLARWPTLDPLGYPDGWNGFAYCMNDVTSSVDFGGMCEICANCGSGCSCLVQRIYYPEWFHGDDIKNLYCLGRDGFPILNPGHPIANAIEDYFPNGHYFAVVHDSWVDSMNITGPFEWLANIGSMPGAYVYSFAQNAYDSFLDLLDFAQDSLDLNIVDMDRVRIDPIMLYQCQCME